MAVSLRSTKKSYTATFVHSTLVRTIGFFYTFIIILTSICKLSALYFGKIEILIGGQKKTWIQPKVCSLLIRIVRHFKINTN